VNLGLDFRAEATFDARFGIGMASTSAACQRQWLSPVCSVQTAPESRRWRSVAKPGTWRVAPSSSSSRVFYDSGESVTVFDREIAFVESHSESA
jgi:hypothetical protein